MIARFNRSWCVAVWTCLAALAIACDAPAHDTEPPPAAPSERAITTPNALSAQATAPPARAAKPAKPALAETAPASPSSPADTAPPEALPATPAKLLPGAWRGRRVEGVPPDQQRAADTLAQGMRFTFTDATLTVTLAQAGQHNTPYTITDTFPRGLIFTRADAPSPAQPTRWTFHSRDRASMTLQTGAKLILERASEP